MHNLGNDSFRLVKFGSIRSITFGLHSKFQKFLFRILHIFIQHQIRKSDVSTFSRKSQRNSFTDTSCCTGNDCCFSFQ